AQPLQRGSGVVEDAPCPGEGLVPDPAPAGEAVGIERLATEYGLDLLGPRQALGEVVDTPFHMRLIVAPAVQPPGRYHLRVPLGGKCGEELGGNGGHGGPEGGGGIQQCVVEVEKHRLDGQLRTTNGTLRRRPFEPARSHSRSRRRRRRAMLELRPRISMDSNNGGETRRPVTPTRSGVKA